LSFLFLNATAKASVKGPKRPANIVRVIQNLLNVFSPLVIPVESPTVPKADTTSKNALTKFPPSFPISEKVIMIVKTNIHKNARKKITRASLIIRRGIDLEKSIVRRLFLNIAYTEAPTTAKVDVFIPPPVDPGEAPINIRKIKDISEGTVKLAVETVLNPAVRLVTD